MKKQLVLFLGLVIGSTSIGQVDKHFSMFSEAPMFLNPAAAGFHNGHLQLFTNFRQQWMTASNQPYQTISGAADWRMFDRGNGFLGTGVQFFNDVAGSSVYTVNTLSVPINYAIQISEENHLAIGLQPGWYNRTMNTAALTWDAQWAGISFNPAYESGETFFLQENANVSRFDIGAGLYWYANLNKETRVSLGAAAHHLTGQKINFFGPDDRLMRKYAFHGQMEYRKRNSIASVMPAFYGFIQGPNKMLAIGSNFKWQLRSASLHTGHFEDITFAMGTYYRIGDAILINMILDLAGFAIGANYDMNISSLTSATSGVGAMEFFLRWKIRFGGRNLQNPQIR